MIQLLLYLRQFLARVYNPETFRVLPGAFQISLAYLLEKDFLLLFKTIQCSALPRAFHTELYGQVEQQRHIRLKTLLHPVFQQADTPAINTAPSALVGVGGIGKTVT
jgi:hypothetical protein